MLIINSKVLVALAFIAVSMGFASSAHATDYGQIMLNMSGGPSWKGTSNKVVIEAQDKNFNKILSYTIEEGIGNDREYVAVYWPTDALNPFSISFIEIDVYGKNMLWIDYVDLQYIYGSTGEVKTFRRWGTPDNGIGYCVSDDPEDAVCNWCHECVAKNVLSLHRD